MCYDICEARGAGYARALCQSPDDARDPLPCALPVLSRDPATLELFPGARSTRNLEDYFFARYPGLGGYLEGR